MKHLNDQELGVLKFTKEEEENNKLAVLDLELNLNRQQKRIEFNVHYKKTHTNIIIKKRSNHRESTKRGVIKGYSDRARALCNQQYLEQELTNIEDVFVENGYSRKEVKGAMKIKLGKNGPDKNDESETNTRGMISIPNVPKLTQQFNKIAKKHRFKTTTKADNKVRDVTAKARTPLGEKNTNVTYNIPCGCEGYSYTGETNRM